MGAAGDLGPDKGVFATENMSVYLLQCIPSVIVITITGASVHVFCADPVFLKCLHDFELIVLGGLVDDAEAFF